jgi:hypothetical protein
MPRCDICYDSKRVRLPTHRELGVVEPNNDVPDVMDAGYKEFDCPQCVPMVPYRRVRAMKVTTGYPAEVFANMQVPIERGLAARFGEYLMREGLIKFSTSGSTDNGGYDKKITVTAHLGVVSRAGTIKSGAIEEVAMTARPPLPERIRKGARASPSAVRWTPPTLKDAPVDPAVMDEFDEPKDAIGSRFSGLDIG